MTEGSDSMFRALVYSFPDLGDEGRERCGSLPQIETGSGHREGTTC